MNLKMKRFFLKNDFINSKIWYYVLIIICPLFMILSLLYLNQGQLKISNFVPFWNDEIAWYRYTESLIAHPSVSGYNGYNGTHAQIGGGGPWGIPILIPYTIFGAIFGWNFYSPVLANLFYITLANLIFLCLTKPNREQSKSLLLISILLFPLYCYIITAMSECIRVSTCIVVCGMLYRLITNGPQKYSWITLFIIIIVAQMFLPFIIFIPIYFYFAFPKQKVSLRILIGFACALIVGILSLIFLTLTSAPYPSNLINSVIELVQSEGIVAGICMLFQNFSFQMRANDFIASLWISGTLWGHFMSVFWLVVIYFLYKELIIYLKNDAPDKKEKLLDIHLSIYLLLGAVLAYGCLYELDGNLSRIGRGMLVFLVFVLYYHALRQNKQVIAIWVIAAITGIFVFLTSFTAILNEHILPTETIQQMKVSQNTIEQLLENGECENSWDNTVAIYMSVDRNSLILPPGMAINYMMDPSSLSEAKYAFLSIAVPEEKRVFVHEVLNQGGYKHIYEDCFGILYCRTN